VIPPSRSLPPLEFCRGTSPIHAARFRPDLNALGSGTVATRALASTGADARHLHQSTADIGCAGARSDPAVQLEDLLVHKSELDREPRDGSPHFGG
jgi:hypothetical protein